MWSMVTEVQMPALSPTMTEGKIVSWNKKEGDNLNVGDVILEVETDKAVMEVEAQNKGVLGKILYNINETVAVGTTIALILEKGENNSVLENYQINKTINITDAKIDDKKTKDENKAVKPQNNKKQDNTCTTYPINENAKIFASPLAKNIAKLNNIDITNIQQGSGPNGRIIKSDVEKFISQNSNVCNSICAGRHPVEFIDIEPTGMRKTVARRLLESKQQIPHWYLKFTANMKKFIELKNKINSLAKLVDGKPEFKISVNDIIVMAVAHALRKNQKINASWIDGDKIRQYNNIDIAVAVAVEDGIFTPIIRNADQKGLLEISSETKQLVKKAKDGKLSPQEFQGGGIAISNLGMYGVQEFCSIINPPQSCIIAVGAVKNSVIALDENNFSVCPTCTFTLSADHRVIDGAILALFASDLQKILENPEIMIM